MKCKKYKGLTVLYLYNELDKKQSVELENHLKECPECAEDFKYTQGIFLALDEAGTDAVPDANWEKCWHGIDEKTYKKPEKQKGFQAFPRWVYAAAGVLLIFVLGFLAGRMWFPAKNGTILQAEASQKYFEHTLQEYFSDLKPVLVEYSNYSPETKESGSVLMDKRMAQNLIIQNILLRKLVAEKYPSAAELLEDIDLILKEIANLNEKDDQTPSMIKELIHEKEVLFKMEVLQKI